MQLSDAEWKVMRCLWRRPAATARELCDELAAETGWAYTTVKTLLDRLARKKAVGAAKRAGVVVYAARIREDSARRSALQGLLERAFPAGVAGLLQFLVDERELPPEQRAALRAMLAEEERKEARRGRRS